ncbi:endonuclease domain-containing protein [Microbacterium terregens]|uniref:Endonuclease domain-containing protein n=1 Tax=Microbacterium terregens TaxID=69363 RepID=A0ABV5T6Q9_9MICO
MLTFMDAVGFVRRRGRLARSSELRDQGATNRELTDAVRTGALVRPRRGWLALPDADPGMLAAARAGVVLTCVTQAARLGLWVLAEDGVHVAAPPHSGGVRIARHARSSNGDPPATVHWTAPLVPRHPGALVDPIENVLYLVAMCQPFESALAVWESAMRTQLVSALGLSRFALPERARRVLAAANPFSDSGLESFVVPRLRWLRLRIVPQTWIAGHRVDFLIGERLVLQIDGGHHVGRQREEDIAHDAQLMLLGYHVIRVGYRQVVDRWHEVQDVIMRAVGQGLHLAS